MKLCIAEKPSVAREIAKLLKANTKRDGYYESANYTVTWTFGHLCSLYAPDDYRKEWKKWQLDGLPMLPERFETKVMPDKGVKKQFDVIKKLCTKADLIINCGDAGQEGELIQRWVLKETKCTKPIKRLWISSLTTEAMKDGFRNLKNGDDFNSLYYAGMSRAIGDWILGMNATRLYTLKYGSYGTVLSIGRVQTPTLAMVVERHHEIEKFVSTPFWELETLFRGVSFRYEEGRFEKKDKAERLLEKLKDENFKIANFEKKKGKEYAPRLFDLTSLQVFCNKRFGLSADQTLKIAQSLYERKVISYPRVDTTYLPHDQHPKIAGILAKLTNYSHLTQSLLGKPIKKSKRVFNDKKVTDHHAIIPTGQQTNLDANHEKVYDAIVKVFIANFYPDCIVSNTTVYGEVVEEKFKATGKEIIDLGWKEVIPPYKSKSKDDEDSDESDKFIPVFKKDEIGPHEPKILEKKTSPPKYFTEATLLRAMETAGKQVDDEELRELMKSNGIGRPSTRANIIETLFKRDYITRVRKNLHPTNTGIQLVSVIENPLLKSAELTGMWEKKLKDIEDQNYSPVRFINEMKSMVDNLVTEVRMSKNTTRITAANPRTDTKKTYKKKTKGAPSKKKESTK